MDKFMSVVSSFIKNDQLMSKLYTILYRVFVEVSVYRFDRPLLVLNNVRIVRRNCVKIDPY